MSCLHRDPPSARPAIVPVPKLNRGERKALREKAPLKHTAHICGYPRLNIASVEAYKAQRIDELMHPKTVVRIEHRVLAGTTSIGIILLAISAALSINGVPMQTALATGYLGGLVWLFYGIRGYDHRIETTALAKTEPAWLVIPLCDYEAKVPQEVRDIAAQMSLRCPDAVGYVEYLYEDPFFFMTRNVDHVYEKEYLAFWDENGFVDLS